MLPTSGLDRNGEVEITPQLVFIPWKQKNEPKVDNLLAQELSQIKSNWLGSIHTNKNNFKKDEYEWWTEKPSTN